jgi:phage-related protein
MPQTQAVYYRDTTGLEPVNEFIESLPDKPAAKIDDYVEEYLNGRPPDAPPPEFPIPSQIEGELRELRVRFANTRYRVLYQRSDNLIVLLHAFRRTPAPFPTPTRSSRRSAWPTSSPAWTPRRASDHARQVKTHRRAADKALDGFIKQISFEHGHPRENA